MSILGRKTKQNKTCSSGPTIFHPIQEGSRQMGAATSPRLARWARKPCHLTRLSSGHGGQTGQDALSRQCHFFFFWKQEEHLAKRILSSQWNDVRRDLLSRAAAGASLRQAGPPACALCQFSCGKRPSQFRSLLEYSEDSVSKAIKVP